MMMMIMTTTMAMMTWKMTIRLLDMILTQCRNGSARDTNHAGVSDANLAVARDTGTFKGSRVQGSKHQGSRLKGLGLIHQQPNDQSHAKQTQNKIGLLQFIFKK